MHQGFSTGTTGLIDRDKRLRCELVLLNDALHQTRHLVGAAALTGHDDEVDRLLRLPGVANAGESHCGQRSDYRRHDCPSV